MRRNGELIMKNEVMKYTIETIKEIVRRSPDTPIVYFWGHTPNSNEITTACLSQWYDCLFEADGIIYHTAEQYMMANKALLFGDNEVYDKIMTAEKPNKYKKMGREIRNFDSKLWDARKYEIVVNGNKAKFSQNPDLKEFLLSTGDAILVEASPYDKIWGIGIDKETAMKCTVEQWQGENQLGCALMEVRNWLREAKLGRDQATVSKWVTNSAQPNLESLLHIAKVLEVNVNDLVRPLD